MEIRERRRQRRSLSAPTPFLKSTDEEGSVKRDGWKITSTSWIFHHQTCRVSHVCVSQTFRAWTSHGAWIFHHDRDHNEQHHGGNDRRYGPHDELHMPLLQLQHLRRAFLLHRALNLRRFGISNVVKRSSIKTINRIPYVTILYLYEIAFKKP